MRPAGRTRPTWLRLLLVLAVAGAAGLLLSAQAFGDDARVEAAYKSAVKHEAKRIKAASKGREATLPRLRRLVRTLRGADLVEMRAVRGEHTSTGNGRKARTALLEGLKLDVKGEEYLLDALATGSHGDDAAAFRLIHRGEHLIKKSRRYLKRARTLFARARKLPPDTKITMGPVGDSTDPSPVFVFSATKVKSKFRCQFDGAPLAPCTSPFMASPPLDPGPHTFTVLATDSAGRADLTPATAAFTVTASP